MTSTPADAAGQLSPVDGLAQLSFVVAGLIERQAAAHNLTMAQARMLGVLRDRTPTMLELARLLSLDKSSTTGLVDRAERRGLVLRAPSAMDRRSVQVSLTLEGRAMVSGAAAAFGSDVEKLLGLLSPGDRDTLTRLISRLLVAHAATQGIDLLATADAVPDPGTGANPQVRPGRIPHR